MFNDKEFIEDERQWPGMYCCLKSRPRAENRKAFFPFGVIHCTNKTLVHSMSDSHASVKYADIDEMLHDWIVD